MMTDANNSTAQNLRFDGEVAIITGAAGGLGSALARHLAASGASLLLNDIARNADGSWQADVLANEITALGGVAVADTSPVGSWDAAQAIVDHAVTAFGRIDMIVNSVLLASLGPFSAGEPGAVDAVLDACLLGSYRLTHAAWPTMTAQGGGRLLAMSSNSVFGYGYNAPYATAKAGMIGLALDNAHEGAALGIRSNILMPLAYTQSAEQIPDPAYVAWVRNNLDVETVVRMASLLLHRDTDVSGRIYSCGGGHWAPILFAKGEAQDIDAATAATLSTSSLAPGDMRPVHSPQDDMASFYERFPPPFDAAANLAD